MNNKIKNIDCLNFEKLLPLMLKNKLNIKEYIFIKHHMNKCENCKKKYQFMHKIVNDFKNLDLKSSKNMLLPLFILNIENREETVWLSNK